MNTTDKETIDISNKIPTLRSYTPQKIPNSNPIWSVLKSRKLPETKLKIDKSRSHDHHEIAGPEKPFHVSALFPSVGCLNVCRGFGSG